MKRTGKTRRTTLHDVARAAQVSPQTVSNFLSGQHTLRPATQERVEQALAALDYQPHAPARALKARNVGTVALLLEDPNGLGLADPLHAAFANGAMLTAHEESYSLTLGVTTPGETEAEAQRLVRERRADGVILSIGMLREDQARMLCRVAADGAALVLLQQWRVLPGIWTVAANDDLGAAQAVEHLLAHGHRRIAFVSGTPPWPAQGWRLGGARAAATAGGVRIEELRASAFTVEAGREAAREAICRRDRPTAFLAANDVLALAVIQEAMRQRASVPEDISVIGFNDSDFSSWVRPSITTVRLPGIKMGARAAQLLIRAATSGQAPESVLFQTELVIRESTGPAP